MIISYVTDSTSQRLLDGATSSVSDRPHTLRGANVWEGFVYHRMAHCVLIRCFPQPYISDVPQWRNGFSISTDSTSLRLLDGVTSSVSVQTAHSPRRECVCGFICHRMAHFVLIRCFPQPYISDVPQWRTSCLYGVSHSRTSPM